MGSLGYAGANHCLQKPLGPHFMGTASVARYGLSVRELAWEVFRAWRCPTPGFT